MTLAPNLAAARAFLHRLDPEAVRFTFQTFADDGTDRTLARIVHADPTNGALDELARLNARGAGVFVTVNATDGRGRQARNIEAVRALFVDLDGAPLAPVLDAGLEPHIVCETSPGRFHAYWLCDDCPLDQFERAQRALARRFAGDPSVHDLPRVLRVPGFLHRKGEPFASRVLDGIGFNGPPYALAEIVGALGLELDAPEQPRHARPNGEGGKVEPGSRHGHLFALGRSMARKGLSPEAVRAALAAENAARCAPPLPAADVEHLAGRAFAAKHAPGWQDGPTSDASGAADDESAAESAEAATGLHSRLVSLADLDQAAPAPHFVERILPADEVTLLGGHGGLGKSYFALLLALHIAAGRTFGPLAVRQARVLLYSAEDGAATLRYRLNRLCLALAIDPARLADRLHLLDMSDADAALHREQVRYLDGEKRISLTTATLDDLDALVHELAPGVVIIDGASDTFDDDEVSRARVRAFVRSLRQRIARPGRAVLLLAHVNKLTAKAGAAADGEAYSGSTAWHNSVRSRLALIGEPGATLTLQHQKANHAAKADPISIEFRDGVPALVGQGPHSAAEFLARQQRDQDERDKAALLLLVQRFEARGERVTTSATGSTNVHRLLAGEPGFPPQTGSPRLLRLLRELQDEGRLFRVVVRTPDRKRREVFQTTPESAPMPADQDAADDPATPAEAA